MLVINEGIPGLVDTPAPYDLATHGVTQGLLNTWLSCPYKALMKLHRITGDMGNTEALEFGNIVHKNLEQTYAWWNTVLNSGTASMDVPPSMMASKFFRAEESASIKTILENVRLASDIERVEIAFGQADALLESYYRLYESDFFGYDWKSLEQEFCVNVEIGGITVPLRGKLDGVFEKEGELWLFETKTKSKIDDPNLATKLFWDLQTNLYLKIIHELYGKIPKGFVYNLMKRPLLRKTQRESVKEFIVRTGYDIQAKPNEYFRRIEVEYTYPELKMQWNNVTDILHAFVDWFYKDAPTYRNPNNCVQGWGACEYLRYCGEGDTNNFGQRERMYPELEFELQLQVAEK